MDKEKEMLSDEKFVPTFRILQDFCQWIVYIAEILQNPQAAKKTAKQSVWKSVSYTHLVCKRCCQWQVLCIAMHLQEVAGGKFFVSDFVLAY